MKAKANFKNNKYSPKSIANKASQGSLNIALIGEIRKIIMIFLQKLENTLLNTPSLSGKLELELLDAFTKVSMLALRLEEAERRIQSLTPKNKDEIYEGNLESNFSAEDIKVIKMFADKLIE